MAGETAIDNLGESSRTVIGTEVAHVATGVGTQSAVSGVGAGAAGTGSVFGVFGVTIAAGISLVLNQINYQKKVSELKEMYKDEVGNQLGKSPNKVTDKDVELVAKGDPQNGLSGNKTIAEALRKLKTHRNIGMVVTTGAILGTLGILAVTGLATAPIFGAASFAAGVGTFAVKALMVFAIHSALEKPMKWAAKKVFNMEDTTNDLISNLRLQHRNGKAVSREQVVEVFVSSNKELSTFVKDKYGRDFDNLNVQQKREVTDSFEQYLPVTDVTENLNSGRVKISELAWAVDGKSSGVEPGSVKDKHSLLGKVRESLHTPPKRTVVEYDNPTPQRSFVDRLAAEKSGPRTLH